MSATFAAPSFSELSSFPAARLPRTESALAVPPAVRRGSWRLPHGQAMTLRASAPSVLRIRQGRVWVTRDADADLGSEDLVLAPGESLTVPAGSRIVMEPWDCFGLTYSWDKV